MMPCGCYGGCAPLLHKFDRNHQNIKQYLAPWFDEYFKKVHPGKNLDDLMKQTRAAATLEKGEVRMTIFALDWK